MPGTFRVEGMYDSLGFELDEGPFHLGSHEGRSFGMDAFSSDDPCLLVTLFLGLLKKSYGLLFHLLGGNGTILVEI